MFELDDVISPLSLAVSVLLLVVIFWFREHFREKKQQEIYTARRRRYLERRKEIARQVAEDKRIPIGNVTDRMIDLKLAQDRAMLQAECDRGPEEIAIRGGNVVHRKKINGETVYS